MRRGFLSKVKINWVTLIDEEEIKARVCRAYWTLLNENGDGRPHIRSLWFRMLGEERSKSLEEPFFERSV